MRLAAILLSATVVGTALPAAAHPGHHEADGERSASPFVGRYDGSSFETYVAMVVLGDGTFEWVLSVGALDMRSKGKWVERDGVIHLTTLPKPVPAEFRLIGLVEQSGDGGVPVEVKAIGPNGKPFTDAETVVECANGARLFGFVAGSDAYYEGYEPDECDAPAAVTVRVMVYDAQSPRYDLYKLGWQPGQALKVEFLPNDIGVLDLTGMHGTLEEGVLTFDGPLGRQTMRKLAGE